MQTLTAIAAYGREAGSSRVRLFDWIDFLEVPATEVAYTSGASLSPSRLARSPLRTLAAERRLSFLARRGGDRLVISRRASPFSSGRLESGLLRAFRSGVYDFDDAIWLSQRAPFSLAETWKRAVSAAGTVIAGNEYLAEAARNYSDRVVVIPSCVDPDLYARKRIYDIDRPTAVWIGSPSTEPYLRTIAEPLRALHDEIGLRLRVVSAGDASLGSLDIMTERVAWRRSTFAQELATSDVGIMPLPDDEWTRGKCAYKLLQYGAAGLPVVGSPVGANTRALAALSGRSARNDGEWYLALRDTLTSSAAELELTGQRSLDGVLSDYSFAAWSAEWARVVLDE